MVSSVSGSSSAIDVQSVAQFKSQMADRVMQDIDSDQDGKLTKDELESSAKSAEGPKKDAIEGMLKMLDNSSQSALTKDDVMQALENSAPPAGGPPKGGGAPPAGGPPKGGGGGGGKAAGATESDESSSTTSYDPKDTNRDGEVSMQEEMAYVLKQYQSSGVEQAD